MECIQFDGHWNLTENGVIVIALGIDNDGGQPAAEDITEPGWATVVSCHPELFLRVDSGNWRLRCNYSHSENILVLLGGVRISKAVSASEGLTV